jgi:hypothetical protein
MWRPTAPADIGYLPEMLTMKASFYSNNVWTASSLNNPPLPMKHWGQQN